MDIDGLKELVPHYVAVMLLVVVILTAVQAVVGEIEFWFEIALILLVVFAYRVIVMRLGVAPSGWE